MTRSSAVSERNASSCTEIPSANSYTSHARLIPPTNTMSGSARLRPSARPINISSAPPAACIAISSHQYCQYQYSRRAICCTTAMVLAMTRERMSNVRRIYAKPRPEKSLDEGRGLAWGPGAITRAFAQVGARNLTPFESRRTSVVVGDLRLPKLF